MICLLEKHAFKPETQKIATFSGFAVTLNFLIQSLWLNFCCYICANFWSNKKYFMFATCVISHLFCHSFQGSFNVLFLLLRCNGSKTLKDRWWNNETIEKLHMRQTYSEACQWCFRQRFLGNTPQVLFSFSMILPGEKRVFLDTRIKNKLEVLLNYTWKEASEAEKI